MDFMDKVSKRIIELRESNDETQQELADAIGITRQSLSRYELATRTINVDVLGKLAQHFNVTTDYLMGLSDVKTTEHDMKIACKVTGLSEKSIKNLTRPYQQKLEILEKENNDEMSSSIILIHCEKQLMILNLLFESKHFFRLLAAISHALSSFKRIEQWGKDAEIFLTSDNNPDNKINCETAYNAALLHLQDVISTIIKEDSNNAEHNTPKE